MAQEPTTDEITPDDLSMKAMYWLLTDMAEAGREYFDEDDLREYKEKYPDPDGPQYGDSGA